MLKYNNLKVAALLLASISIWGMEGGEPMEIEATPMELQSTEESITLVAGDGSTFNLVPEMVKLSGTIQDYLKDAKEAGIEDTQMPIQNAEATTLALFTNLANDVQQAIDQEKKDSDKALDKKIQAPDGHIFAKNLQPVVNESLQNQDMSTLEKLLKLTHFLDIPQFENAIASVYTAQANKDLKTYDGEVLQIWLEKLDLPSPTKWLLTKHWYLQKAGITDEWSINDLLQTEAIKPYFQENQPRAGSIYKHLQNKIILGLDRKQLTSLDGLNNIPGIKDVQVLSLYDNQLIALPENAFDNLTTINVLYLGENKLTMLPKNIFKQLTALVDLDFSGNQLITLPENIFESLSALDQLGISNNQLTTLPENIFNNQTALTRLNLQNNQITTIPEDIFRNTTALKWLDLGKNKLTTLPENIFKNTPNLFGVHFDENQLTTLPENIFDNLTALQTVGFSGLFRSNPIPNEVAEKIRARLIKINPNIRGAELKKDDG